MRQVVDIEYAPQIRGFAVSMPSHITLAALEDFGSRLLVALSRMERRKYNLLIDSNRHDFESIACLKKLRDILEEPAVAKKCERVAFVQPVQFRAPHIPSEQLGYFDTVDAAYEWLKRHVSAG